MRRRLVVGNWKMNGDAAILGPIVEAARCGQGKAGTVVGLAVPHTLIAPAAMIAGAVVIGSQDVHEAKCGAHTGDVSAAMVRAAGAAFTIVGHSERRRDHGETDASIARKMARAHETGLDVLLCCGEPMAARAAGCAADHVENQLAAALTGLVDPAALAIAYEPCWAIGSGSIPAADEIVAMVKTIRASIRRLYGDHAADVPVLYGGSVRQEIAQPLAAIVPLDGVLVGGASLDPAAFGAIVHAFA